MPFNGRSYVDHEDVRVFDITLVENDFDGNLIKLPIPRGVDGYTLTAIALRAPEHRHLYQRWVPVREWQATDSGGFIRRSGMQPGAEIRLTFSNGSPRGWLHPDGRKERIHPNLAPSMGIDKVDSLD